MLIVKNENAFHPVGCVPSAAVAVSWGGGVSACQNVCPGGGVVFRMGVYQERGVSAQGQGVCQKVCLPVGVWPGKMTPPPCEQNYRRLCDYVADGNKRRNGLVS